MQVSTLKLDIQLAKQIKGITDLRSDIAPATLTKIKKGDSVSPKTVGRLAKILNCDVEDLIAREVQS